MEHHAKELNRRGGEFVFTSCDPSGASERATLLENGIVTIVNTDSEARKVKTGIEMVRQALVTRQDGTSGFYVSSKCSETIRELNLYSYPDNGKDEPKKEHDHTGDCIRYFFINWRRNVGLTWI